MKVDIMLMRKASYNFQMVRDIKVHLEMEILKELES